MTQRRTHPRVLSMLLIVLAALGAAAPGAIAQTAPAANGESVGATPPRLSYVNGEVSYWRPGAADWAPAQVNTPLAPGDQLYTSPSGTVELEIGARAFVRAWGNAQIGLESREPDFLQIKVTTGEASLDLRALDSGHTVEVDTPGGAFTIERTGYYRVSVTPERIAFTARRGGTATAVAADGQTAPVAANEQLVVDAATGARAASPAPAELDAWDRWNYDRTAALADAVSTRYVSPGVYGTADLDRNGSWRVVETYGPVWVPRAVPAGWAPYTTGRWVWDPIYGWTWIDTAPWGWAPYHYGRWVSLGGLWAWAPGPLVRRPAYAPALVVFFGGAPGVAVATPVVGWCPLGWGEPVVPWWGRPGFAGVPWWGGWGGPRVVNNVVISRTTVVNVSNITVYRNAPAVVVVDRDHFGRGPVAEGRVHQADVRSLHPVHGALVVAPTAASLTPGSGQGARPPHETLNRPVVTSRQPGPAPAPLPAEEHRGARQSQGPVGPAATVPPAAGQPPVTPQPPAVREQRQRQQAPAAPGAPERPQPRPRQERAGSAPEPAPQPPRGVPGPQAPAAPHRQAPQGPPAPKGTPAPQAEPAAPRPSVTPPAAPAPGKAQSRQAPAAEPMPRRGPAPQPEPAAPRPQATPAPPAPGRAQSRQAPPAEPMPRTAPQPGPAAPRPQATPPAQRQERPVPPAGPGAPPAGAPGPQTPGPQAPAAPGPGQRQQGGRPETRLHPPAAPSPPARAEADHHRQL